jgi:hypothetical protein
MRIAERFTRQLTEEDYTLSVVDTDGDELLESARLRATDLRSAWEQAIVSHFALVMVQAHSRPPLACEGAVREV